ncbi:hypothetical protein Tco_0682759 [Tanacetum coccineum]|uniref:Tf2-1-like SH3-like domain-containing protein n=1 Tax=Tanacetum coccineum TaxID=301880 RepID=A0ABQ4XS28_9ASTR
MLKVSPWKGVVRFGKRGKLNPRYVGPFKVLEKVGSVAYKLELLEELSRVHNTFHVSNLKKCYADEPLAVMLDGLRFDDKASIRRGIGEALSLHRNARSIQEEIPTPLHKDRTVVKFMSDSEDSTVIHLPVSNHLGVIRYWIPQSGWYLRRGMPWRLDDPQIFYAAGRLQSPHPPDYLPAHEEHITTSTRLCSRACYVPESDPEEDDDEDPKEDPADYPADRGEDGDDEDEPSDDDEDDEVYIEADDEEEEEHPTPANATAVALPAVDQAPSADETEPFKTDESAGTPPLPEYRLQL